MKNQRDKLRQYQKKITLITSREKDIAKECLARGEKDKALLALRRKKYQESLLAKTDSQLEQLEKLTSSVEFALVQKDVVFGLQQGTQVLQQIHKEMGGLEAVEKLMGETEDARAYQQVSCLASCGYICEVYQSETSFGLAASTCTRLLLTHVIPNRRSVKLWQDRCRTKMKTKSRTSLKQWRKKSKELNCQMRLRRPLLAKVSYQMFLQVSTKTRRVSIDRRKGRRRGESLWKHSFIAALTNS
jgi:charged multivesicular body protein 6